MKLKQTIRDFLIYKVGKTILHWLENMIARYSAIGNDFFFDANYFDWTSKLEDNWQTIRKELDVVLESTEQLPGFHDISPDQYRLSNDGLWKTFFLYGYGIKIEQNCQRCPLTASLIESIPGMKTAFFSILLPGKHIPEHRGPYKGLLRYQLALKVPQDRENCLIRVGTEFRHWLEGKSLLFDDSFVHEAWNKTNEIRVILFMDIVRPTKFPVSVLNLFLINLIRYSPYVKDAYKNQKQWHKHLVDLSTS
ncbi:MAG: aspartyl/asparaginyl beta-hydroxylase domain-containing protein [Hyellaceae cyanobacterium CSU_1_1]|nr:aspartyl/asparaginyl beta-hydroxylase domain-containing protein [Hyellaceae cyanobacterium CSU_1_1]